jgi:hypothetical protein
MAQQPEILARAEAIRRLFEIGLAAEHSPVEMAHVAV